MDAKKWIHPKNGETRVYLNGFADSDVKVFVVAGGSKMADPDFPVVKIYADRLIDKNVIELRVGGWLNETARLPDGNFSFKKLCEMI